MRCISSMRRAASACKNTGRDRAGLIYCGGSALLLRAPRASDRRTLAGPLATSGTLAIPRLVSRPREDTRRPDASATRTAGISPTRGALGELMASTAAAELAPTREDFAALLDESYGENEAFEGSVIKGKGVAIEKDVAVIDIGLKTEGRVALKEFTGHGRDPAPAVGDEVEVYLERVENALGEAVISRDKARREESWVKLEKAFEGNEKVEGVIFNQVKGGFTVDLDGAVAFLPRSQVDVRPVRDVGPLMNSPQPFRILKMDKRRGNIVVSRRSVLEDTLAEQRSELVQRLHEGQIVDGVVKHITEYGALLVLGGIDGLLHVSVMAWWRVNHPSEILNIGETLRVQ